MSTRTMSNKVLSGAVRRPSFKTQKSYVKERFVEKDIGGVPRKRPVIRGKRAKAQRPRVKAYGKPNRIADSSAFRSSAVQERNTVSVTAAPYHEQYGPGERWSFRVSQQTIGRSGTSPFNEQYRVMPYMMGTVSSYAQVMTFGSIWGQNSTSSSLSTGWATSTYTAAGAPTQNLASAMLKFFQYGFIRHINCKYTPSCPKTTTGTLAFAPLFRDSQYASMDERNFNDIASMPGSVTTAVCDPAFFTLLKGANLNQAGLSTPIADPGLFNSQSSLNMLAGVNTVLGTSSDVLGQLTVNVVIDLYGKQWVADDTYSALTSEERRMQNLLTKLGVQTEVKETSVPRSVATTVEDTAIEMKSFRSAHPSFYNQAPDSKEAKAKELGEHKDLISDWAIVDRMKSIQAAFDRERLRTDEGKCQSTSSTVSGTASSSPNVKGAVQKS